MQNTNNKKTLGAFFIIAIVLSVVVFGSLTIISPQQKGIVIRLGSIKKTIDSGLNLKAPIIDKVVKIDISTVAVKGTELAYSKDSQTVSFEATINYNVDPNMVTGVYKDFKKDYEARFVLPAVKEAIKVVASGYTAQGIIDNRSKLSSEIRTNLSEQISSKGFYVSAVTITNIDFDDSYENAIVNKQVQEQQALAQVNITKQEDEKKKQEILKAEALSEKTRLEAIALQSAQGEKLIDKLYAEAALEASKKWNGVLPTQMIPGQTLPFIQLGK
jgi:regulator of protease activity HflC (stomatin/prohibitin superfamily)